MGKRIAAVVHVDGSARPQIIERETNPLYYDILDAFERESGLPVLVNTSFNVHEEPIVNKPSECIRALLDGRIDFVEFPRSPANAKGRSVDLVGLAHLDPAQRGDPTGQIEQDFIGAGPTDQGQTGGATRYSSDWNVNLRKTANTGDAS